MSGGRERPPLEGRATVPSVDADLLAEEMPAVDPGPAGPPVATTAAESEPEAPRVAFA